ncbi:hypothetical protein D3C86_1765070 [compost metagenome]
MIGGQFGEVERQAGAHDDGIRATVARLPDQRRVGADGLHHVDGDHPLPARQRLRRAHLAVKRDEVGVFDRGLVASGGAGHQVGVMVAQVDAGDGAHGVVAGHGAGEPVRGYAHAHAALHDRKQLAAGQVEPSMCHEEIRSQEGQKTAQRLTRIGVAVCARSI